VRSFTPTRTVTTTATTITPTQDFRRKSGTHTSTHTPKRDTLTRTRRTFTIGTGTEERSGTELYAGGQVLYMNPLTLPVWLGGLWFLFSEAGQRYRLFGWLFLTVFLVQIGMKSKPYYLAPAFPPLFVAGGLLVERVSSRKRWFARAAVAELGAAVVVGALLSLPTPSLEKTDRILASAVGWAVPPLALTHDLHDEYGWREQAETIARVRESALTPDERARAIVFRATTERLQPWSSLARSSGCRRQRAGT
jgi:hypothetical protein